MEKGQPDAVRRRSILGRQSNSSPIVALTLCGTDSRRDAHVEMQPMREKSLRVVFTSGICALIWLQRELRDLLGPRTVLSMRFLHAGEWLARYCYFCSPLGRACPLAGCLLKQFVCG